MPSPEELALQGWLEDIRLRGNGHGDQIKAHSPEHYILQLEQERARLKESLHAANVKIRELEDKVRDTNAELTELSRRATREESIVDSLLHYIELLGGS